MNWIRENKFLTGFLAVLIVGAVVLGYLLYSAMGENAEVQDRYTAQAAELHRLQTLAPYPSEANLKTMREQKQEVTDAATSLHKTLSEIQLPPQAMTATQFQDTLRTAVSGVAAKAKTNNAKLPDKFYLGFDTYQNSLPPERAAAALGSQLRAIELAVNLLLDAKVDSVNALQRTPLPDEGGAGASAGAAAETRGAGPGAANRGGEQRRQGGPQAASHSLVNKVPFEIEFTADQNRFRKFVNDLVTSKQQFYILRTITVKNQNPTPPPRFVPTAETPEEPAVAMPAVPAPSAAAQHAPGTPGAAAAPGAAPAPGASPAETAGALKFIVGTEKLDVAMRVEIVSFAPQAAEPGGAKPTARAAAAQPSVAKPAAQPTAAQPQAAPQPSAAQSPAAAK